MKMNKRKLLSISAFSFGAIYSSAAMAVPYTPPTVTVAYGGNSYTITSQYVDYTNNAALLASQPWWGNAGLSFSLADLVKTQAGGYMGPSSGLGALFAYGTNGGNVSIAYWDGASTEDCPSGCPALGYPYYYATLVSMSSAAITLTSVAESLVSTGSGISSTVASTNLLINGAHSRPLSRRVAPGEKTAWIAGDWGRDDHGSNDGSLGMTEVGGGYNFGPAQINLSIGKTWAKQDLINNGNVDADGKYLMVEGIIPVSEAYGLYGTLGAFGNWGASDIRRGYISSGSVDTSKGSPDTRTWGLRARLDWENAFSAKSVQFSPYVDVNYFDSHMDSYTETEGDLPARFNSRDDSRTDLHIGVNAALPISGTDLQLVGNIGGVHSFNDRGARTSGEVIGLFGFNLKGEKQDSTWMRAGAGVEGMLGEGKASLMLNATTEGEMSNVWLAASYQIAF